MPALLRRHDWPSTTLGPVATWPPALRTAVDMMLHSSFPMFIAWGPELVFLYNDANIPLLGERHPAALGARLSDVWPEVWPYLVPMVDRALSGKPVYHEDMELNLRRYGHVERAMFTFSFAPLHGADGETAGLFCTCMETTARVLAERRAAFELRVSDAIRPASLVANPLPASADSIRPLTNTSVSGQRCQAKAEVV